MKNLTKTIAMAILCGALAIISSCHRGETITSGNCPGPVIASWKVDGTSYQSSTSVTTYDSGFDFTLTLAACVSGSTADRTVTFEVLHDLQVTSYPLRWKMLHANPPNGYSGADYLITNGGSYFTDSVSNTGVLNVTAVNTSAKTYSGNFQFTAVNDAGTGVVHITDGTFTNIPY
ncbi:MAG: hypothetical protein JWO03_2984 [Bacteroidetes bacterium]|nr:hypothetical protein [Bacteroidota bacterium]